MKIFKPKIRPFFYSISINSEECDSPSEVYIQKHNNSEFMHDALIGEMFNRFETRKEAVHAREKIIEILDGME